MRKIGGWLAAGVICWGLIAVGPLTAQTHEWTHIDPADSAGSGARIRGIIKHLRYPVLDSRDSIEVASFIRDSKLTLLWYFASWCWNCNQEIPLLQRMYNKYHDSGFRILGIGVYSPVKDLKTFRDKYHITFPIVVGPSRIKQLETRQQTDHYSLRKLAGDQRTWGTPFNLWIVPQDRESLGVYIAAGEIHHAELQDFLETHLP